MAILLTVVKHFPNVRARITLPAPPFFAYLHQLLSTPLLFSPPVKRCLCKGSRRFSRYRGWGGKKVAGKVERNFVLYMSTWNGQLQRSRATLRNRSEGTAKWVFNKISSFVIVLLRLGRPIRKHLHCATASRSTLDKGRNARIHCNGKFLGLTYACNALSRGCCDRSMNNRLTAVSWENVKLSTSSSILLL